LGRKLVIGPQSIVASPYFKKGWGIKRGAPIAYPGEGLEGKKTKRKEEAQKKLEKRSLFSSNSEIKKGKKICL